MLPILYQSNEFILYSYPILMGIGWGIAYQIFFSQSELSQRNNQFLYWGLFISAWIGSKLLFLLTTGPLEIMSSINFWLGGGFVFYGGVIFASIFYLLYRRKNPISIKTQNALILSIVFGHGIGRIGCFLAGCCYGKVTDSFLAISLHGHDRYPTQVIEALGLFVLGLILYRLREKRDLLSIYLIGYGVLRLGIEFLRGDELRGLFLLLTPGQWISIVFVITGAYMAKAKK